MIAIQVLYFLFYILAIEVLAFGVFFLLEVLHLVSFVDRTLICVREPLWRRWRER